MRKSDIGWEALAQRVMQAESSVPALNGAITRLIADMRAVKRLYGDVRISDHRLMGVDLENLAEGLDNLCHLRNSGVRDELLDELLTPIRALVADMSARTQNLVRAKISEAQIQLSVATARISVNPDADATPEPPIISHPGVSLVSADPSGAVRVPVSGITARISGEAIFGEIKRDRFTHVHKDLMFLREGQALRLARDDAAAVWCGYEGQPLIEVMDAPVYRVEPVSSSVQIHGPAFVSRVVSAQKVLTASGGTRLLPSKNYYGPEDDDYHFRMVGCAAMLLLISILTYEVSTSSPELAGLAGISVLSLMCAALPVGVIGNVVLSSVLSGEISTETWWRVAHRKIKNRMTRKRAREHGMDAVAEHQVIRVRSGATSSKPIAEHTPPIKLLMAH